MTKDKRMKPKWRKKIWWMVCLALVFGLVLIAILAATGTIFKAQPQPIESRTFGNENPTVNAAGIVGHRNTTETTTGAAVSINDSLPIAFSEGTPTTEEDHYYVPNALQGQLTFHNVDYLPGYNDTSDPMFMSLASSIKLEMESFLTRMNPDISNVSVRVMALR